MSNITAHSLIILILSTFCTCRYMEPSYIKGSAFTIIDGDTVLLDSVIVDFYNTEKYGGSVTMNAWTSQDFQYSTTTRSNGRYQFQFKFAPLESVYEITFRRRGYIFASQVLEITYENLEHHIVYNQELQSGILNDLFYQRHQKIKVNQSDTIFYSVIGGAILIILTGLLFIYGDRVNIYMQDLIRNVRRNK
ncbi:MAG: hypothetical protein JKX74_06565 [Flavobacteriales bacterium]|nr:hypothetical protein [Flavobacteriales bacterium]